MDGWMDGWMNRTNDVKKSSLINSQMHHCTKKIKIIIYIYTVLSVNEYTPFEK